ncbi:MAG: AbrB family transcriptional regulator, partial [Cyanobacteria bacterium J06648_11]
TLDRETFIAMRELWQPALMCAAIAISTGVLSGLAISKLLGMEPLTALLGTAPGGLSDISLIALDMGAQGSTVLIMHLTRLISVIAIVPWIVRAIARMGTTAG